MVNFAFEQELRDYLAVLEPEQQRQVLEYARALGGTLGRGVPGKSLLRFAGTMAAGDVAELARSIAETCETIDPNGW
jgi:hypothetical protein